jgi:hypothetical protein
MRGDWEGEMEKKSETVAQIGESLDQADGES